MRATNRSVRRGPVAGLAACLLAAAVVGTGLIGPARATAEDSGAQQTTAPSPWRREAAAARSAGFQILHLLVNNRTVYPVSDGYRDDVVVTALTTSSNGAAVAVTGSATISRAARTVQTFPLHGALPLLSWDGLDGGRIVPGTYRVEVVVRAGDGTERHAATSITVSRKHLQTRIASIRTTMRGDTLQLTPPRAVRRAQQYGPVSAAIRTVAAVTGDAHLIIRNPALGEPVSLPLRDGRSFAGSVPVPEGTDRLTLERDWEPGSVTLRELQVLWTYSTLA